ncbi:MAG: 4-alpha-glucanotransferase [Anaerolineae bacterium]
MQFPRAAGILMHPTSLPNRFGIGDLGSSAYVFIDFLVESGQSLWQILPLGPTGYGDSPYQCFSAFAGNPLLISLETLQEQGDIEAEALAEAPDFPATRVDYGQVIPFKYAVLNRAARNFRQRQPAERWSDFETFCAENAHWLDDFALFMALKDAHGGAVWNTWEWPLVSRDQEALEAWRKRLDASIFAHRYFQYSFFRQWEALKHYANEHEIKIIGDIPIFVAYDSAEVWANPERFKLDEDYLPSAVAGVPPDYFSPTGQLWGNPLYRWEIMAEDNYAWWIERFRQTFKTVDIVRLDHFRGFEAYWEIPAGESTAINGEWVKGPGAAFFETLREALGELPIIAEDLGFITPEVEALRDAFELPGMKILQFAFAADARNPYLPHNYRRNVVVYTGTHDNDTTVGWYRSRDEEELQAVHAYLGPVEEPINWALIRMAYRSVADTVVIPLQDVLGLGSEARMNTPAKASGNWTWRFEMEDLEPALGEKLKEMAVTYGRAEPKEQKEMPEYM